MVPHVAARKAYQRLSEFLLATPKRLLQQYRHLSDMPTGRDDVRFRVKTGSYGQTGKMTRLTHSDNR